MNLFETNIKFITKLRLSIISILFTRIFMIKLEY